MNTINKFNTTNLGSIAKVQTGPFGSQLHERDYVEKGTPIITVEHLGYGRIIKNDIPCVSESDVLRLKKFLLKTGDIVFSRVGSVDRSVLIRQEEDGWMFSGRCLRVRLTTKDVLPAYLYYYFTQNSFRQYVRNNAVGATMPSLNSSILRRLKILYPSLSKQKQINDILSAIDDTLANNYTRIQLFEEAARLLFREWFVYFKFPGREKVKIIDGVPEGWKKEKINKLVSFKRGVEPGSDNYLETYESGSFPFFRVSYLVTRNPSIFVDEQYVKNALLKKSDIVISLDGSVGIVSMGLEGCYKVDPVVKTII
jgi:type I restriction enzyme S subunit